MSTDPMNKIEDEQVRRLLQDQMEGIVSSGLAGLEEIKNPRRQRLSYAAEFPLMAELGELKGGPTARQMTAKMNAAVWKILCNVDEKDSNQGVPDPEWAKVFKDDGIAAKAISYMVTAAVAALGSLGGPVAAALSGAGAKLLIDWILKNVVLKALDEAYQHKLEGYCKFVPAE
jgi:hypothetical protein